MESTMMMKMYMNFMRNIKEEIEKDTMIATIDEAINRLGKLIEEIETYEAHRHDHE